MGHSSLIGIDPAPLEPSGRDTAALGPSDSSDTGSDVAGIDEMDDGDPGQPVDVAMNLDARQPLQSGDTLSGSGSDSAGTGERRSAASDSGREGADIGVDRIFDPDEEIDEAEDADLAFIDQLAATATPQPGRPNPEPDPADPGDGEEGPLDDEDREERKPGRD
ncbi:MAG TPA: hypothetical protein VK570_14900 [Rubrivivax sp.]|nr:hypothetical protein [Rubrivivax sp.]